MLGTGRETDWPGLYKPTRPMGTRGAFRRPSAAAAHVGPRGRASAELEERWDRAPSRSAIAAQLIPGGGDRVGGTGPVGGGDGPADGAAGPCRTWEENSLHGVHMGCTVCTCRAHSALIETNII